MANSNLKITIANVAGGMDRLNVMKADMKKVLGFLATYLFDFLSSKAKIRGFERKAQFALIKQSPDDGTLEVEVTMGHLGSVMMFDLFYVTPGSGDRFLLVRDDDINHPEKAQISTEGLAKEDVLDCYRLVEQLLNSMTQLRPDALGAVKPFCDAMSM